MKIESKKGTKKPLYALGASILAATTLMAGCNAVEETIQLDGETETGTDYTTAETTLETISSDASSAYLSIALDRRTFTPEEALDWAKKQMRALKYRQKML